MPDNSLGKIFRITVFGESHGRVVGVVVDGVPAGLKLSEQIIQAELDKRRPGFSDISTTRLEEDKVQIYSGVLNGFTTGAPICMMIENKNVRSEDYEEFILKPRPGHADLTAYIKYSGFNDYRGGGQFSGRITASFVMAGAVAKQLLATKRIQVLAYTYQIAGETARIPGQLEEIKINRDKNPVYSPDGEAAEKMIKKILDAKSEGDSVGGVVQCMIIGLPPGVGEPVFSSIESVISKAVFSIPGVKGIEFGSGFKAALMKGSEHNDWFKYDESGRIITETNNSGGVLGGLTTGMPVIFNVAFKPTSSITKEQKTVNLESKTQTTIKIKGRHDPCIVPRAVPVVEAITAVVIADLLMQAGYFGQTVYSDKKDLKYQRNMIQEFTLRILELFKRRLDAAEVLAKIKAERHTELRDIERENTLISEAVAYAKRIGLPEEYAASLVRELIKLTVKFEEETVKKSLEPSGG